LEYPDDVEGAEEAPGLSLGTSSTAMTNNKKSDLKRGQHERHQIRKKVHVVHKIGPNGQPLEPTTIIGTFSNQCSCIVREKVPIKYDDWRKVPNDIKGNL